MKIGKVKIKPIRLLRAASQILFFIFLPALYISTFSGIKEIYLSIYQHHFDPVSLLPQIVEAVAVIPVTLLLGRFFCGWVCSFGAMGDFISMLSHKIFKKRRFRMNETADRLLRYVKYVWLVFLIVTVWSFGSQVFRTANPWDAFGMLLTPGSAPAFSYVLKNLAPALAVLLLIIGASFFVDRFFCRYLCPLGAIFSLVSKLRIARIQKPRINCGKCRVCTNSCPMGICLYRKDECKSGECIHCFECVANCPRKNISFTVSNDSVRPAIAGAMTVAVMAGIYYAGSLEVNTLTAHAAAAPDSAVSSSSAAGSSASAVSGSGAGQSSQGSQSASSSASTKYKDGTYQGSGNGFRGGTTTVSVTIKSDKITDIQVVSTQDTPRFFNSAYSAVTQSILSSQTAQVDAVSGATYSSNGIMQAVADALSRASA